MFRATISAAEDMLSSAAVVMLPWRAGTKVCNVFYPTEEWLTIARDTTSWTSSSGAARPSCLRSRTDPTTRNDYYDMRVRSFVKGEGS